MDPLGLGEELSEGPSGLQSSSSSMISWPSSSDSQSSLSRFMKAGCGGGVLLLDCVDGGGVNDGEGFSFVVVELSVKIKK